MDQQLDLFGVANTPVARSAEVAHEHLPETAQRIHDLVGLESMVRLVNKWGGCHLDFPRHRESFQTSMVVHAIADEIGLADALKLADLFQGSRLHVPTCKKALQKLVESEIKAELDKNTPAHVLARRFKLTERSIWRIAKRP